MPATINLSAAISAVRFSSSGDTPTASSGFRRRTPILAVASPATTTTTAAGSLYEVLRVEHNASPTEIKSAFRSLAKQYHPDVAVRRRPELDGGGGGGGDFIEIRNAYETLSDPSARAMYDLSLIGRRRRLSKPLGREQSCSGYYPTRRWETDQCW